MSPPYLDYEIMLLLAKYGKSAVLGSLSRKLKLTPAELEAALHHVPAPKAGQRSPARRDHADPTEELAHKYPKKAHLLRTLRDRFQHRQFLPELRDVKRFFEQHRSHLGSIKSRADSFPRVLQLLSELNLAELEVLCRGEPNGSYSSLELIADEILRKHG